MKRIISVFLLIVLFATSFVSQAALAEDKKVTLSLGTTSAAEDIQTKALEKFAELASEKSNGSLTINVFPAAQLGDAVTQMESMIFGGQDLFCEGMLSYMYNYGIDELGMESFGVVPDRETLRNFVESDLMAEYKERFREKNGIVTLAGNFYRQPIVMATKTELKTIDDFKGYKLRVVPSEALIFSYSALGFNPTSVAYNEVYLGISQGVIEGTIAPIDAVYTMKFFEVAPFILKLGPATTNVAIWMNEKKWNSLTESQQQALQEAAQEAGDWYTATADEKVDECIAIMEAAGVKISEPSPELWSECFERWAKAGLEFEKMGKIPAGSYEAIFNAARPNP